MPISWSKTKPGRAHALRVTVAKGPSFNLTFCPGGLTPEQRQIVEKHLTESYKLWMETWVMPELNALTAPPAKKEG